MIEILPLLIFAVLVIIAVLSPQLGGLLLLFGYALGGRTFAMNNLATIIGYPIFITEPILLILLCHAVLKSIRDKSFLNWEWKLSNPWIWFYAIGLINLFLGLIYNHPISAMRDSVIIFYGLFTQVTFIFVRNEKHILAIYFIVVAGLVLRFFLQFFYPVFGAHVITYEMYTAVVVLATFGCASRWQQHRWLVWIGMGCFLGTIIALDIRTVWLAFVIAYMSMPLILWYLKMKFWSFYQLSLVSLVAIVLTMGYFRLTNVGQYSLLENEFHSFFIGVRSPNLVTRLVMWEDAIEEVVPWAHPLFNVFDRKIINPILHRGSENNVDEPISSVDKESVKMISSREPSATSIINSVESGRVSSADGTSNPMKTKEMLPMHKFLKKVLRFLIGVPFGEKFIPGRIYKIHFAARYDPHNSVIAVLYRGGILGLIMFLWILLREIKHALRVAKETENVYQKELIVACLVGLVYFIGHSMTDVTLENPFKGAIYWILLGLLMVVRSQPSR